MAVFPVWVGGLSLDVREHVLHNFFHKFGPIKNIVILKDASGKSKQCGFVNFLSQEAAETAAIKMEGYEVMGQAIKTKGPRELSATGKSTTFVPITAANSDKRDFKALTDCVFYMEKRECFPKTGRECPFRHCLAASQTDVVCERWIQKQCMNVFCPRRHPKLFKQQSDNAIKVIPARCPSHNAFKCTGECGFDECNTHFMEQDALQEHIKRGREKKISLTSSCSQCKAIFFSEQERQKHSCLNTLTESLPALHGGPSPIPLNFLQPSIHVANRNGPVLFTNASPQNLVKPHHLCNRNPGTPMLDHRSQYSSGFCDCSRNETEFCGRNRTGSFCVCTSCGKSYENSGDSLSDFDLPVNGSTGIGGHRCPNSPSAKGHVNDLEALGINTSVTGSPSQGSTGPEPEPIGVFWDIENCPVPRGKSASAVVQKIRKEFFTGKREAEFMCVCDISKEKKEVIEELNKAQVTVVHINATSKNAADDKLRQSLRRFGQSYPPPATVILVSGDINFAAELSDLRHRHNLEVICLHNAQAQPALLACAHEARRFDHFTADLPVVFPPKTPDESGLSSELLVLNLPMGKDAAQVKNRLKKLSDNCGGKVVSISGRTSVLKFPNPTSAERARRRMDKEDVFGSTIQVVYSTTGQGSPQKGKRFQPAENTDSSVIKGRDALPKSSPLQKNREGSNAMLDDFFIDNGSTSRKSAKPESTSKTSSKPPDDSPESSDSTDENGSSLSTSTGPQIISHQTMFSNGSYTGIWPHPIYPNFMNMPSQGTGFPGITPLTPPLMGGPQLAASWLASLHNFTVLDQQRGGIDLLVTNLDESVSKKELKKKLASVFREHCKVFSVILHSGEGIPLRAFVKVPKLSDANLAILKVHQRKIFNTNVTVSIATDKEKELCFLRCEVTSILKEAPLHFLPLNKFLNDFYEKCSHAFDMSAIGLIHDLVVITGKPGNQAISLVTRAISAVKVSVEPEQFAKDVHSLLKSCDGALPLVSFAASYWLKFDKNIELNDHGATLSDVLCCVPNVKVTDSLMVSWMQQAIRNGGNVGKLLELSKDLQDLLLVQDEFKLPLSSVISEYQMWFEKKTPFDPIIYGFTSVVPLLQSFPSVVEVKMQGSERWLSLSQPMKIKAFEKNLKMLLESQPDGVIALGNFVSTYMKFFGRKCKIATFGFSKLTDLIEAVPTVAKILGTGDQRLICLVEKDRKSKTEKRTEKQTLVKELKELLSCVEGQKLPVATVLAQYFQHFGRLLKIGDYGARRLEDLIEGLPSLQITEISGTKFLVLPPKVTLQSLRKDVVELLELQEGKFLLISRLATTFRKHHGRKFPLGQAKLEEFIKSLEGIARVKGSGSDKILLLPFLPAKDKLSPGLEPLADKITTLLMKYPGSRVAQFAFPDIFLREYDHVLKPKDWGYTNMDALTHALGHVIEVQGIGNMAAICIKQDHLLKVFSRRVIDVLIGQADKSIPVSKFVAAYEKLHNHKLRVQNFGFASLEELLSAVSAVVKLDSKDGKIRLTPLQCFAIETRDLLRHLDGCVSLNRFAPNFQQLFGRPCKAADYGFNRISEAIDAMSNVAEIRGKGAEKMVVLVDGDNITVSGCEGTDTRQSQENPTEERVSEKYDANNTDSASPVIVEEDDEIVVTIDDKEGEDLIVLDGEGLSGTFPDQPVADDWLMAPVPESLPEPDLQPAIPEPPSVGDLISFTEFDMDVLFAAIDNMGLPNPLSAGPGGDLTELLAESNELSGEYNGASSPQRSYRVPSVERRSTLEAELNDLELPYESPVGVGGGVPPVRPSPVKPGVMLHSEVEADILSHSHSEPVMPRILAARFTGGPVEQPLAQHKSSDEEKKRKSKKFTAPKVNLAPNFSKTTSKQGQP